MFTENQIFEQTFVVSDEIYRGFGNLFKDFNPLHTNNDFARKKGFKGAVMYGNILNGFLSYFIGECLPTKDVIIHSQEIHFKNAVYLGNTLHFKATVAGVFESVNVVEFKYEFRNEEQKIAAKGKISIGIL
ncbi:MAG: MaoC family dehydratase [Bacteroidetes bacterium]|nr:MaoC family dehydratase [Bacteroidota bacterium]